MSNRDDVLDVYEAAKAVKLKVGGVEGWHIKAGKVSLCGLSKSPRHAWKKAAQTVKDEWKSGDKSIPVVSAPDPLEVAGRAMASIEARVLGWLRESGPLTATDISMRLWGRISTRPATVILKRLETAGKVISRVHGKAILWIAIGE